MIAILQEKNWDSNPNLSVNVCNALAEYGLSSSTYASVRGENDSSFEQSLKIKFDLIEERKAMVPSESKYLDLCSNFYQQFLAISNNLAPSLKKYCTCSHFMKCVRDNTGSVSVKYLLQLIKRDIELSRSTLSMLSYSIRSRQCSNPFVYIRVPELEQIIFDSISDTSLPLISQGLDSCDPSFKPFYVLIVTGLLIFHSNKGLYTAEFNIQKLVTSHIYSEWLKFCDLSNEYYNIHQTLEEYQMDMNKLLYQFKYDTFNNPFSIHKAYKLYNSYMALDKDGDGMLNQAELLDMTGFEMIPPLDPMNPEDMILIPPSTNSTIDKILDESLTNSLLVLQARSHSTAPINVNSPPTNIMLTNAFVFELFACGHIGFPHLGMDFKEYLQFYFAFKYKRSVSSYHYFWRIFMNVTETVLPVHKDTTAQAIKNKLTPAVIGYFYQSMLEKYMEYYGNAYFPNIEQMVTEVYDILSYSCMRQDIPDVDNNNCVYENNGPNFHEFCHGNKQSNNNKQHQGYVAIHLLIDVIAYKKYEDRESLAQQEQLVEATLRNGDVNDLPAIDDLRSTQYDAIHVRTYKPLELVPLI